MNVDEVRRRFAARRTPRTLPGIAIDDGALLGLWNTWLPYLAGMPFPSAKTPPFRFHLENPAFSYADAAILYSILRQSRPKRLVEVGSGYSSACALDTIDRHLAGNVGVTFIEPNPGLLTELVGATRLAACEVVPLPVQDVDVAIFEQLDHGDVLFIDSTHVLKTGSDVCHELFSVLPALKAGVLIQFHDVFWPFEYPEDWVLRDNRSWNEIYALRAFLSYNTNFEILFFNDYFCTWHRDQVQHDYPAMLKNTGGSLWLRKVK